MGSSRCRPWLCPFACLQGPLQERERESERERRKVSPRRSLWKVQPHRLFYTALYSPTSSLLKRQSLKETKENYEMLGGIQA